MNKIMDCKNCGKKIVYNSYYHCYDCSNCGKVYNGVGQELRPVEDWRDDYEEDY